MNPFLKEALKEAHKAKVKNEVPVGAVVVHNGKIIGRGHNVRETKQNVLTHAELIALLKASKKLKSWRLVDCDVYVTLEPCAMCAGALWQARVRAVYYGARDPKAGAASLRLKLHNNPKLNHRYVLKHLETQECGLILSDFFKMRRQQKAR